MKQKGKRTLTPKLRFPEFRDLGKWNEQKLGEIVELEYGSPLPEKDRKGGRFPVIGSNGIVGYHDEAIDDGPAIVVGRKGSAGKVNWIESDCYPIDTTFFVKNLDPESCPIAFLWRLLERSNLERLGDAGAVPGLNRNEVYLLKTYIPDPAEQQKIAECLSSLDGLIAAEGRKLAALRDHKRGLMQQLFPQPGQTQPRLRFPEFRNVKSEFRPVGTFAKVTTGNKDTQNKVDDGEYPFFVRSQNVERIDSFAQDCEAVLTSGDGVGVGENYHYINGKFDFHQRVYCIYDFNQSVSGKFFFHYFSTHFRKRVKEMSAKNSVDSVRMAMITEMPVWMPPPAEQHRIAACLTALDDQIAAQAAKIETLKQHKRGLMQQLFPAPEEQ